MTVDFDPPRPGADGKPREQKARLVREKAEGNGFDAANPSRGNAQALPAPFLRGIVLSKFKNVEIRRRKWIVPNYIPDETVTMLTGDGGIGKSLIAKQLAVARALSREWIGLMPEPGRTLMLSCEDDEDELLRRIDSIRKFHGAEWEDLDDFLPVDLVGEDSILGLLKQGIIEPTPMYRSLDVTMGDFKPGLTILDVLADLFCGDERVRTQARQFVNLLKALCRRHRQAILLLAHPSLTGMNSGTGTSGSTDWSNGVRSRLYFKPKDGAGNENIRTLQGKKANYSEVGGAIDVVWRDGLFAPVTKLSGFNKIAADAKADDVFLTLVKRFNGDGRNIIDTKGTAYAPAIFAAQPDAQGVTNEQFRAAMERLFKNKKVHIVDNGTKSKPSRTIVITESLNL
jgi:RecA-family ATPase